MERLDAHGLVVGVMPGVVYEPPPPVTLNPGDLLVLYTDGCSEAESPSKELYGEERLVLLLQNLAGETPAKVLDGIRAALLAWTKKPRLRDDLTLMALKR